MVSLKYYRPKAYFFFIFLQNHTSIPTKRLSVMIILPSREEGIRTLDTLLEYTHFPGVRLRPLGHLSNF